MRWMYLNLIKIFLDLVNSIVLAILFSPFILSLILLSKVVFGKCFFVQKRMGFHGKVFKLYKFPTMYYRYDSNGVILPDIERTSKWGDLIRRFGFDELPQIINVLKGDVSFIGPRPLLPEYADLYTKLEYRRHSVKPGITGWAQIHGRNELSWKEKFEYDVWYVDNVSFLLDLRIYFITIFILLFSSINGSKVAGKYLGDKENK